MYEENEKDIKQMVDEDILYCSNVWEEFSHDKDKMCKLFNDMLFKYINLIDGIENGLIVISTYEENIQMTNIYCKNVEKIINRLKVFRDNNYTNEGLMEFYFNADKCPIVSSDDFLQLRADIGFMDNISQSEKDEIQQKITEIERICSETQTRTERWNALRPYVIWVSGKNVRLAMKILPIFLKLN